MMTDKLNCDTPESFGWIGRFKYSNDGGTNIGRFFSPILERLIQLEKELQHYWGFHSLEMGFHF